MTEIQKLKIQKQIVKQNKTSENHTHIRSKYQDPKNNIQRSKPKNHYPKPKTHNNRSNHKYVQQTQNPNIISKARDPQPMIPTKDMKTKTR